MPARVVLEDVVCPFCAMVCDDLAVVKEHERLEVHEAGCARARAAFARAVLEAGPAIDGRSCPLDEALDHAAGILAASRLPLVAGLGTDTEGMRAALALAEATGGILDHAHGQGLSANLLAMQSVGWFTATLAEARNRPDLVLLVGGDGAETAPRLAERVLRPPRTIGSDGPPARRIVQLGGARASEVADRHLPCPDERLLETVGALRALVEGTRLPPAAQHLLPEGALAELARALREAAYALVVWEAGALAMPHRELLVEHLARLLQRLNATGRAAGLPLAGPGNVTGCNQVCAWQTGLPLRTGLAGGVPDHDPHRYATATLLAAGSVDALLWIAALEPAPPPAADLPCIVLATPLQTTPARGVYLPVATPGLDHAGSVYRMDGVVAMPLRGLRRSPLPTVAELLGKLRARLAARP